MVQAIGQKKAPRRVSRVIGGRTLRLVQDVAARVRSHMEEVSRLEDGDPDLGCYCLRASVVLRRELRKKKVAADLVYGMFDGDCHCWVRVGYTLVDVTATQFNDRRKVVIEEYVERSGGYVEAARGRHALRIAREFPPDQKPQHRDRLGSTKSPST
jgi:hypothetical protein